MESVDDAVQTPEEQVRAFFVAQAALILQAFKERVVYQGLDFHLEELVLDQELADWAEKLNSLSQVQLGTKVQAGNVTVQLTPELKKRVFVEVLQLHEAMLHACKDPGLAMTLDSEAQAQ